MSRPGPLELVVFDCDGVLVDSEPLAAELCVEILHGFGMNLTKAEVIDRFMGRSEGLMFTVIEEHIGRRLSADELEAMDAMFTSGYDTALVPVNGIGEALDAISLPTCVASSSKPEGLRRKLGLCGLLQRFDGRIFSATQVANGKPAPDLFLFAAATLGVEPARCIVVEDSPYGVQAARAAGMRALAYLGGMVPAAALEGPDTVLFDDMRELPALIASAAVS